jgi:hypothetical protein
MPDEAKLVFLVPITFFLVTGAILVSIIYFNFRQKQMLIERGFTSDELKELMKKKEAKSSNFLPKAGIIMIFFGIGLGLGKWVSDYNFEIAIPVFIFVFTGIGMIVAYKYGSDRTVEDEIK